MFYNCSSLISLDISNFDTSNVHMSFQMFYNCSSLISLDISNFKMAYSFLMYEMFHGCSSLRYLFLSNLGISEDKSIERKIFERCYSLQFINLKSVNISNDLVNIILNTTLKNLTICTDTQNNFGILFEKEQKMICNNNISINDSEEKSFNCYMEYISEEFYKHSCEMCGKNYFQIYNDENNNNSYINCYNSLEGYYLDLKNSIYKLCYLTCKTCKINGDEKEHNCLKCNDDYIHEYDVKNYKNCYKNKLDKQSEIQNIKDNLLNELNFTNINNGIDQISTKDNLVFILTSTENQKNNKDEKYITMDLGECGNNIKRDYNIPENDLLYILQIISEEEGMKIPKLEYEVYYPFKNNSINLTKLNLTSCKGIKVEISIKVDINDTLDKYNPKSDYYHNICFKATSESGTDISLKDRQNEFINNNMSLCEENCDFVDYNYTTKKVICSCEVKLEITKDYDIKFNKNEFFKNFIDIKNMLNLNVIKCFKFVMTKKDVIKNFGFFFIFSIIFLYIAIFFIFSFYSFYKLKMNISKIVLDLKFKEMQQANNNI